MSDNWVYGFGPSNAKLMIVGEALGKTEEEQGKAFVGLSGEIVTELLSNAGLKRSEVYITNVVKIRPPDNDLGRLSELGYKIEDFLPLLWQEVETLRPNCILALGALALETLTGKKGIVNYRGSILSCLHTDIKVIPTIHPAAILRVGSQQQGMFTWKQKTHIQFDFMKAAKQCEFPEFRLLKRNLMVIRSTLDFHKFLKTYEGYDTVYVDTEVYKAHLTCIGFAFTPYEAASVPLVNLQTNKNHSGIPLHELTELWVMVDEFLRSGIKIIGQNFKADKVYWLEEAGFRVANFYSDTMFKFHTLSPELPKSLAFQQSILTDEPFHKYEGKEYNPLKDKIDVLLHYNAKDCVVNCECDLAMNEDLKEFGLEDFFYNFVMPLYPVYEKMEKQGLRVDFAARDALKSRYEGLLGERNAEAIELTGRNVNYNSPKQVREYLFGELRLPQRKKVDEDTLTAFINVIKDKRKTRILELILERRSIHRLLNTYIKAEPDYDGRMRTTYNQVGTETGRTSTGVIGKPLRTATFGASFQTIPKHGELGHDIRSMYIPDPGKIFIEFDQSQAEARVVALLAKDYALLRMFDLEDVHVWTASYIYNCLKEMIDSEQRHVGKAARHGLGYDEGYLTLAVKSNISNYRSKIAYDAVHKLSPSIKEVFHEGIQDALANNRKILWTPFGRRREFFGKWERALFREAYAHIPQSTIADNTKRTMLGLASVDWIEILIELHDGFVAQIPENRVEECYDIVKPIFEQSIDFERCTIQREPLTIPIECQIGYSWGDLKKWTKNR